MSLIGQIMARERRLERRKATREAREASKNIKPEVPQGVILKTS